LIFILIYFINKTVSFFIIIIMVQNFIFLVVQVRDVIFKTKNLNDYVILIHNRDYKKYIHSIEHNILKKNYLKYPYYENSKNLIKLIFYFPCENII